MNHRHVQFMFVMHLIAVTLGFGGAVAYSCFEFGNVSFMLVSGFLQLSIMPFWFYLTNTLRPLQTSLVTFAAVLLAYALANSFDRQFVVAACLVVCYYELRYVYPAARNVANRMRSNL